MVRDLSLLNLDWVAPQSVYGLNLSHDTVLQTLKVRTSDSFRGRFRTLKALLPTIASPIFSGVVVVFSGREVRRPPQGLAGPLCGVYRVSSVALFESSGGNKRCELQSPETHDPSRGGEGLL